MQNEPYNRIGYQSAVGAAIVAAVFSIFVAILLSVNVYRMKMTDPARSKELEKMKEQAKLYPADQTLTQEIQQLDAQLRRDQFARLYFLRRGTILLVVTLALFTGFAVWASSHRPGSPRPQPQGDLKVEQIQHASRTRLAFTTGLVLLCGGALFWVMHAPDMPAEIQKDAGGSFDAAMEQAQSQWSTFRGPGGLGIAKFQNIPDTWDAKTGRNILWKQAIPLPGHNSPIVWNDRLFLTGATKEKQQVYSYDKKTGKLLWQRDVSIPPNPARDKMNIMEETGYAASTAVTDGKRVCAVFAGGDVGCFTVDGQPLWEKHIGIPDSAYGYAASLTWFENIVLVQWDVGYEAGESKLLALDWQTGSTAWETQRPVPNSWSSPTVVNIGGQYRVVTTASPFVIVYDPEIGAELYRVECIGGDVASTPIIVDKKIIAVEPYNKLVAINADETSQDNAQLLWESKSDMPDICSPLGNGQFIWTLTTQGYLSCFNVADGAKVYTEPMKMNFQASPTLVGQTLYLLSEKGTMVLIEAGASYKEIRRNELDEKCLASPAFQNGRIYIRGDKNLYAIGKAE